MHIKSNNYAKDFKCLDFENQLKSLRLNHSLNEELKINLKIKPLLVGGVDCSPIDGDNSERCIVGYSVYAYRGPKYGLELKYKKAAKNNYGIPYTPGYLGFRESKPMVEIIEEQMRKFPCFTPDVLLVDGNGILHPVAFGSACHVGVRLNIPTIGVGKALHNYKELPNRWEVEKKSLEVTPKEPYFFPLQDNSKEAVVICPNDKFKGEPLYISQGHKISLKTALKIVEKCIVPNLRRLPEPLFMADLMSREQVCEQYKDSQLHVNQVEYEAQRRRWNTFIRNNLELDWKEKNQLEKKLKTKRR